MSTSLTMRWEIGQTVQVQSRTWAGINKPGGCAKITKVHRTTDGNYVEGLDVKYLVGGGSEKHVDPAIVSLFETLERGGRKRRGREFLHEREEYLKKQRSRESGSPKAPQPAFNSGQVDLPLSLSHQAAAAALRENDSSRKSSATYSTPQRRKQSDELPKKVTPIPKLVKVVDKIEAVSPMTEDRPPHKDGCLDNNTLKDNSSVVRGLCFDAVVAQKSKTGTKKSVHLQKTTDLTETKSTNAKHDGAENNDNFYVDERKLAAHPILPSSVQKVHPTSAQTKIIGLRLKTAAGTTGLAASRGVDKRPAKSSFSRTKSAYQNDDTKLSYTDAALSRKPLLDVYRDEVTKAQEFMDDMVARRGDDLDLGERSPGSARYIRTSSRYDEFLSTFRTVWVKLDDEGISEECFLRLFNEMASNSFTPDELNNHIQSLCNEGKLMKSDGILYKID